MAANLNAMEAERESRMAELQDTAKGMDELREQLERAKEAEEITFQYTSVQWGGSILFAQPSSVQYSVLKLLVFPRNS